MHHAANFDGTSRQHYAVSQLPSKGCKTFRVKMECAVFHTHSLVLAYNELKPNNIPRNTETMSILFDLGGVHNPG
ncbi:hypothetical protein F5B20DRAFT_566108 [Whalleya microplaca]|nr:hypothetical protein F5B20DRAFT_566108 [Whalleya microplaca]